MVVDSSALVAILLDEPEKQDFIDRLAEAKDPIMSAATLLEASIVMHAKTGSPGIDDLDELVATAGIRCVAVDAAQAEAGRRAFLAYGKGRARAGLNYGDCFSYALAKVHRRPMLFKGDDFAQTDIEPAGDVDRPSKPGTSRQRVPSEVGTAPGVKAGDGWIALEIGDVDAIDWRRTGIHWRPMRWALGAEIVGMAVFTGELPGEAVIEPHNEVDDGRGHQEIYVVIRGEARFVLDGVEVEAPAGTFLRVDPDVDRTATAADPDTAILALGGESAFRASGSEWIERARPHIGTDPVRAREIIDDLQRELPGDRAGDVGEALMAIARGDEPRARAIIAGLVTALPELRGVLQRDPDLSALLCG